MGDETEEVDLSVLIAKGYDELSDELESTESAEAPVVVPSDLIDAEDATEETEALQREARTVLIDAQAAAMDYAIASSLNPDLRTRVPAEGTSKPSKAPGVRVVKGRMSEPPPIGQGRRPSEPMKIIKGSKIED